MPTLKRYAAKTSQGPYLQVNEDNYCIDLNHHLYAIFDGIGGAGIGDKAASFLQENICHFYRNFCSDPEKTMPFFYSPKYSLEGNALINGLFKANKVLLEDEEKKEMALKGAASGIVSIHSNDTVICASTGNCLSLLLRRGEMELINRPDSLGEVSKSRFEIFLQTSPLSGFGLFPDLYLSVKEIKPQEGDSIIFLTDGAYARVNIKELKSLFLRPELNLVEKINEVFQLSNERGNLDNQTMIILSF